MIIGYHYRKNVGKKTEEEGVHDGVPQAEQVPIMNQGDEVLVVSKNMSNREIRESFLSIDRVITTYMNRGVEPRLNALKTTMTFRSGDFARMNRSIILGSIGGRGSPRVS